jgi:hypothetical protein
MLRLGKWESKWVADNTAALVFVVAGFKLKLKNRDMTSVEVNPSGSTSHINKTDSISTQGASNAAKI